MIDEVASLRALVLELKEAALQEPDDVCGRFFRILYKHRDNPVRSTDGTRLALQEEAWRALLRP